MPALPEPRFQNTMPFWRNCALIRLISAHPASVSVIVDIQSKTTFQKLVRCSVASC